MCFCNFFIISQCKKVWPFHLNKLKSSLPRDAFCQVWFVWRRWFFFYISLHLKNLNSLHSRVICAKFGWNWLSGSGEEDENVKSLRQQQRGRRQPLTTDKFWSEKFTLVFSSGELKSGTFSSHIFENGHFWEALQIICLWGQMHKEIIN